MLQIKNISKQYKTGDLVQQALEKVCLNLRDSEFVAVLGPSGSGKTTLLNVIGGLDRYDEGDLVINGISTKKYRDRDWDAYRNHTIGFVFQSYNLIPHQTILANVELALTISGIGRKERRQRAKDALIQVGLGDQLHKRPCQMSGGQMQRVAIARALVNDPDVLLADEPTGALDTETSVQVMELLKQVANDRLVVMVTHNPELAQQYATRIVRLKDGKITDDTNPCPDPDKITPPKASLGKASMSFATALALSFNNLRTKKGRTILTAFAGSIGIIGIALILSISNGVSNYIADIQRDTMTSYPITIEAQTIDLSSMMQNGQTAMTQEQADHPLDGVYGDGGLLEMASTMTASLTENNLTAFKQYLENPQGKIQNYIGENGIVYSYDNKFSIYAYDPEGTLVNTDGSNLTESQVYSGTMMDQMQSTASNFTQLLPGRNGDSISPAIGDSYDLVYGDWPTAYDQVVLVLDSKNELPTTVLYQLGILPASQYKQLIEKIDEGQAIPTQDYQWQYSELCGHTFYLLPACDTYTETENGQFTSLLQDGQATAQLVEGKALPLTVTGIIRQKEDGAGLTINGAVGYTQELVYYLIDHTNQSPVVLAQQADDQTNVLNGLAFSPVDEKSKIADAVAYLSGLGLSEKAAIFQQLNPGASQMDEAAQAAGLDAYLQNPDDQAMLRFYDSYISTGSYEDNLSQFGVVSLDAPSAISIYTDSFENKDAIYDCITAYNDTVEENDQITYIDYVGILMSSVTTIIHVISYVLIAFVAVSLVVSSIMIGIITYISVLERTKEIGILRSLGASKENISQVFNAETIIVGLCAGLIGIGVSLLLLIPGNLIIHALAGTTQVNAALPAVGAVVLVVLSVVLTLIGGLIPAKKAARKDPVLALRTD